MIWWQNTKDARAAAVMPIVSLSFDMKLPTNLKRDFPSYSPAQGVGSSSFRDEFGEFDEIIGGGLRIAGGELKILDPFLDPDVTF